MIKNSDPVLYKSFLTAREFHQRGDLANAEAIYSRLLALDPADDELLFWFGYLQAAKGATDVGLECLQLARQLKPSNPGIPYTIGVVLQQAARLPEAVEAYHAALALDPGNRQALENLCAACYDLEDYSAGLQAAQQALKLDPASALAIRGAANCLTAMGRRAEALTVLEDGLRYHPAQPELRIHHAWELMANGDFTAGWRELEWRNSRQGVLDPLPRSVPFPRWNGEDLAGKTVLVYGEQGIGDEIMYAPFVLGIINAGGRCILECEARLEKLFARAFPQCTLLHREERDQIVWHSGLSEIDFCISALSLPLYFDHPLERCAFLSADPERVAYWRGRLQAAGPGLKVGVSWRGGADAKARRIRSIPPTQFGSLINAEMTFVSLQYGATAEEIEAVSPALKQFAEVDPLKDMDEFAALVAALNAVVSIDNSTVHLAGALGVKTLLLLPVYSEWRWGNAPSGESPWYRSLEFIRQPVANEGGWQHVLEEARNWLSTCQLTAAKAVVADTEARAAILCQKSQSRSVLLVGYTHYCYHWGCACTSLGLHEGLRKDFGVIRVLPFQRLLSGCPSPVGIASLDSDDFFRQFEQACPDIAAQIQAVDCVVINGEGSIHGARPLPLFLLYLAYVSGQRYGKQVALVNHSCYPDEALLTDGASPASAFYSQVYGAVGAVVVREPISLANVLPFTARVQLGFDCLPRFLAVHGSQQLLKCRKLVLGGSVSWSSEMVNCFAELATWMRDEGYTIEILSGAKALLAGDEIGFVAAMAKVLQEKQVPYELHFPLSEREWLEAIGSASLLVSGRFHYTIAAAFQRVPFLVAESNTAQIAGLLDDLGLEAAVVALGRQDYGGAVDKARRLLDGEAVGLSTPERLEALRLRSELNVSCIESSSVKNSQVVTSPVMIRVYNGVQKGATAFFRNRPCIETLFSLLTVEEGKRVKILVHACSVGAEPYSLALWWIHKVLSKQPGVGEIDIVATDINSEFLAFARKGVYPDSLLTGMTPEEQSWFEHSEGSISIPDEARRLVRFLEPMSFVDGNPGEQFDAVLVMNALTYVSKAEQSAALVQCATYTTQILAITAFHPDSVRDDIVRVGFEPVLNQHRQIYEAWVERLTVGQISPDSPDYSWKLPPYDPSVSDYAYRFGTLFRRMDTMRSLKKQNAQLEMNMETISSDQSTGLNIRKIDWSGFALIEFLLSEQNNIPKKYANCLDIGSGEGVHTKILRDVGLDVFQVDKYREFAEYKEDYLNCNFNKKFDVIFCSHVIEHQRNMGIFLDKIYDDLSDDGVLIISAPKHPAERFVEGHINCLIFPIFLQQLIYAGFDCKNGKFISAGGIENSFIVKKAANFDISERTQQAYLWAECHQARSPIELKIGFTISEPNGWMLYNCKALNVSKDGNNITINVVYPDDYKKIGCCIDMNRWGVRFSI